ncbi:hypothetical protein VNO77_44497 [Canavalia gladiata]|uniref:Dof-type domain-containing protein n=1 Tax=Canavalia gladiata TaxID=3824 RepID=A0AAN9JZT4_CANGL
MGETRREEESEGIKLFGAMIRVEKGEGSEEEERRVEVEKRIEKIIACPRCKSMETKFCYFNNYNVNQPRHFCKSCQRYWTAGGALRNVPIGAGRRKAKPGLVLDDWDVAMSRSDFRHIFPPKRPRTNSPG